MNNRILYSIIAVAFVGGLFSAVYAGPMMPKITLAGDVFVDGSLSADDVTTRADSLNRLFDGDRGMFGNQGNFDPSTRDSGTILEDGTGSESSGIYMDDQTIVMWSPGDEDILRIYDEDDFSSPPINPKLTLTDGGDLTIVGKLTATGGIDPPYISFTKETHDTIKQYAIDMTTSIIEEKDGEVIVHASSPAAENQEVMLYWNSDSKRLEVYVISEDMFYTITGEPIG